MFIIGNIDENQLKAFYLIDLIYKQMCCLQNQATSDRREKIEKKK